MHHMADFAAKFTMKLDIMLKNNINVKIQAGLDPV